MSAWGLCIVRDEIDIVEATMRHYAAQDLDGILVFDRKSSDGTRELLDDLDLGECELLVRGWPSEAFYQGEKMTAAQVELALFGAQWVVPFDCDEIWSAHLGGPARLDTLGHLLGSQAASVGAVEFRNWTHYRTARDRAGVDPFDEMAWRDREALPRPFVKVAFRPGPSVRVAMGNHSVSGVTGTTMVSAVARSDHFPYRSPEQFIRKVKSGAAALANTTMPYYQGQHWRDYGAMTEDDLRAVYADRYFFDDPERAGLLFDPVHIAR